MLKRFLSIFLRFLIIFQFVFPSSLLADTNIDTFNVKDLNYVQHQSSKDLSLLTKQYRLEFKYQNGERITVKEVYLLELDLEFERPRILNPRKDLRYEYHEDSKEFWIVLSNFNSKTKTYEDICAHVFKDVELSSPVVVDSNMMVFATPSGIRATLIERIVNSGFIEPILVPLITPKLNDDKKLIVSGIEFIKSGKDYSKKLKDPNLIINAGDLLLELCIQTPNGEKNIEYTVMDRNSIILNLRNQLIGTLFLASFYLDRSNQEDLIYRIEECLSNENDSIRNFMESSENIVSDVSDNLIIKALKNIASGNKIQSALSLIESSSSDEKNDVLTKFTESLRLSFNVEDSKNIAFLIDSYRKRFGSISKKKKEELKIIYFKLKSEKTLSKNLDQDQDTMKSSSSNRIMIDSVGDKVWEYRQQNSEASNWIESLSKDILDKDSILTEASVKEKNIFKNILHSTTKLWGYLTAKIKKNMVTIACSTAIASFYMSLYMNGVDVGLDTVTAIFKGIRDLLDYSTEIPIISTLTNPIKGFCNYLSQGWFVGIRLVLGVGIGLVIYPLSLYMIKLTRLCSSRGESLWQTFFNFGVRIYARLCYPLVKIIWDTLNQKYLYQSLDIGISPIHNSPFIPNEDVKEQVHKKITIYSKNQDISFISKLIAACIVADVSDIDLRALLLLESGTQVQTVAKLLDNSSIDSMFLVGIESLIYSYLIRIYEDKNIDENIDEIILSEYIQIYWKVKDKIEQETRKNNDVKYRIKYSYTEFFKKTYQSFKKGISSHIIPYILYGKQGLDFYNKYKNVKIDPSTASIAGVDYRNDYIFSTFIYAGVDPEKFGIGNIGNAEVMANEMGHAVVHGIEGAVDPLSVAEESILELPEEYKSLSSKIYSYDKKQSFLEGINTMFSSSAKLSSIGYLDNHAKYILNLAVGFNVRFLSDYLTRVIGLIVTTGLVSETLLGVSDMFSCTIKCIFLTAFFLISRISVSPSFVGYSVVWPYVLLGMKKNRNSCLFNQKILEEIASLIDQGIRFNDIDLARKAGLILKSIYYFSHTDLPLEYRKPIQEFSLEDIKRFNEYTQVNTPIPTKINGGIDFILTVVIGAWVSTVLFAIMSERLYDTNLSVIDSIGLLVHSVLFLGISYLGLKTMSWIVKNIFTNQDKHNVVFDEQKILERIDSDFDYSDLSTLDDLESMDIDREDLVKIINIIKTKDCISYFNRK